RIIDGRQQGGNLLIIEAPLNPDGALRDGRQHVIDREQLADHRLLAKTAEPREREQRRIGLPLTEFAKPRINAAAEDIDAKIGPAVQDLRLTAEAGGADKRARRQISKAAPIGGDKGIARIFARQDAVDNKAG